MKKSILMVFAALMLHANSFAQSNILEGILNKVSENASTIGDALGSVIGTGKVSQKDLYATWRYSKPGCAFTTENLLAKAGGEIASSKIEAQLATYYKKVGFSKSNTYFTFNEDGTFKAKIDGKSWSGTYKLDEKTQVIQLKGLLLSMQGHVTKNVSGISLLFESKKLLTLLQTLSKLSSSTSLKTIGELSKNYDGVRIGFELKK